MWARKINQIPYNIIANQMGCEERELFEVEIDEREDVDVSAAFNR